MIKRSFKFQYRGDSPGITGYAFRFNETVNYHGQQERFSPELKLEDNSVGTFLFRDHNPERVLARVGSNMSVWTDAMGLLLDAGAMNTPLWQETLELVGGGVLNGLSVGFRSTKDRMDDSILVYERIKLFEISLVTFPAYQSSEVSSRDNKTLKNRVLPPECFL